MPTALLVLLGFAVPWRAPDLQVEASNAAGDDLPEMADAVARTLVASGAHVVLRGPASERCLRCAHVRVIELRQGNCRIEVKQDGRMASAELRLPAGSPLFDRARAVAIQTRLLVASEPGAEPKTTVTRPPARKLEPKTPPERLENQPHLAVTDPAGPPASAANPVEPLHGTQGGPAPTVPATDAEQVDAKNTERSIAKPNLAKNLLPEAGVARKVQPGPVSPHGKRWPWIPTVLGTGTAVAAGICAIVARDRYNALSDKSRPYQAAQSLKVDGQNWQIASFVLSGTAVVGLATGLIGFAAHSPQRRSVSVVATPVPNGGVIAIAGGMP